MRHTLAAALLFSLALPATAQRRHPVSAPSPTPAAHWVGTWATAPVPGKADPKWSKGAVTLREIVHVSIGGPAIRIVVSNEFGTEPLTVGAASVGTGSSTGEEATPLPLTFSGRSSVVIPAGALAVSDPAPLRLAPLSNLAVSLFLPEQSLSTATLHGFADATSYVADGDQTAAPALTEAKTFFSWPFLKAVEVNAAAPSSAAIVCFGDSITDGAHSTRDANLRWPDVLASRLAANPATANLGVLNLGIGGNRILHDVTGPSALARFGRDVLEQNGVKYLVILEGINDIGHAYDLKKPYDVVSADDLIAGYKQLITRAHAKGIKVYGATLTPYRGIGDGPGAGYSSPAGEEVRTALNNWIRTAKELDGVIDFDQITRDPANPQAFAPVNDSGDHLHPGDAGYKNMGNTVDLNLFTK